MGSERAAQAEFGYCGVLQQLLDAGSVVGQTGERSGLGSLSTPNKLRAIRHLMLQHRPQATLEIGMGLGGSCLCFAASHRDLGRAPAGQHIAVDPFESAIWDNAARLLLKEDGLGGYVEVCQERSHAVLPRLLAEARRFGLVYVDGSHLFEDVFVDFYYAAHLLPVSGIVAFDDSREPGVRQVLRFISANMGGVLRRVNLPAVHAAGGLAARARFRAATLAGCQQLTAYVKTAQTDGQFRAWDARLRRF